MNEVIQSSAIRNPNPEPRTPAVSRRTYGQTAWRRFRQHRLAIAGGALGAALTLMALLAPWIAPYDADAINLASRWKTSSAAHWLGTDELGRDVLTRIMYAG